MIECCVIIEAYLLTRFTIKAEQQKRPQDAYMHTCIVNCINRNGATSTRWELQNYVKNDAAGRGV